MLTKLAGDDHMYKMHIASGMGWTIEEITKLSFDEDETKADEAIDVLTYVRRR